VSEQFLDDLMKAKRTLLMADVTATARPVLIVLCGLPGSGKSFLSERLGQALPAVVVESDRVRKAVHDVPIYTGAESAYVHRLCHAMIANLLESGFRVVFDATNLFERQREVLYHLADRCQAGLLVVRVVAPAGVARQRLLKRGASAAAVSDADWEVYCRMVRMSQPIARPHLRVDTSKHMASEVNRVVRAVARLGKF